MANAILPLISNSCPSRARLAAMKDVSVVDGPLPSRPDLTAMVMAGLRCIDIHIEAAGFSARGHVRYNEWLVLVEGVDEDTAFAAVAMFVSLVSEIPQFYSQENDSAEREAAAEVQAAFSAPISIALEAVAELAAAMMPAGGSGGVAA